MDRETPATWNLKIGLGKDDDDQFFSMMYKGQLGAKSHRLDVVVGPDKYVAFDFTRKLFYIAKIQGGALNEVVEMQRSLSDLVGNPGAINQDLEMVQRADNVVLTALELNPLTNVLGFYICGFPTPGGVQGFTVPARVRANI